MKITIQSDVLVEFDVIRDTIVLESYSHEYFIMPEDYDVSSYIPIDVALKALVFDIAKYFAVSIAADYVGADEPIQYKKINIVCGGTFCATNISGVPFNFKIIEQFVTGVIYKILRMRARGQDHIYGLRDKQFYERMAKKGYNQKQSKELLKLFNEGKIKTKAKV